MGVVINVIESKFYNQFYNGVDFTDRLSESTNNLAASVMENVKVKQVIDVEWYAKSKDSSDTWTVDAPVAAATGTISSKNTNFINSGFSVGDSINYEELTAGAGQNFTGKITSISANLIIFDITSGSRENVDTDAIIRGLEPLTSLVYSFGLINNDDTFNVSSKVSGNDQAYYAAGINSNFTEMQKLANYKDWKTGSARVKSLGFVNAYSQRFEIEHEFTVVPYYLDGQIENLENDLIPELLSGLRSLKYVYEPRFRTVLSDPNTEKSIQLENNLGSVAWFNENFNGFNNNYEVTSTSYQDANSLDSADGILVPSKTKITVVAKKANGSFTSGERFGVYTSYLPSSDEYTDTTLTDLKENFLYDNALNSEGLAATDGSDFITNLTIASSGDTATITFDVEYSNSNKAFLSNKVSQDEARFIIGVQVGDSSFASGNSDRVMILADVNNYDESADIPNLIKNTEMRLYPYEYQIGVDDGFSSIKQWNEDGFAVEGTFDLNLNRSAVLNSLEFKLIAENSSTGKFFDLDNFVLNVSNPIIQNGIQMFNISDTRGYNLENGSQFNDVYLNGVSLTNGLQKYSFRFAQKISWQDWIANNLADSVFYNPSKPNNNLNFKSSNYSNLNGYDIKLSMFANVTGVNDLGVGGITNYHVLSPSITVYDYNQDSNSTPEWSASVETFSNSNGTNLNGLILSGEDTLFRITWTNSGGAVTDISKVVAIHRIEEANQNGYNIDELGTLYSYPLTNRIIPKGGYTNLDVYIDNGNVVTECLVDGSKTISGTSYSLSGKMDLAAQSDLNGKLTSPNGEPKDTSGTVEQKILAL